MVKHQTTKSSGDTLLASEWNAAHVLVEGLDADKPTSDLAVGQLYWATDTKILYKAISATAWEEILRGETVSRLAQLSEKSHGSLTGVTADQHHAEDHASRHIDGGADAITSKLDFRAMHLKRERDTNYVSFGTSSTTYVDISTLYISMSLPVACVLLVFANVRELDVTGAAGSVWQRLVRDGTESIRDQRVYVGLTDYAPGLIQTLDVNVSSGYHNYRLQGHVEADMMGYWNAGQAIAEINAIIFPY